MIFKKPSNPLEGVIKHAGKAIVDTGIELATPCPQCKRTIPSSELAELCFVCPHCGHHFRINPRQRIDLLCDAGTFTETDTRLRSKNPLDFPGYDEKLQQAAASSGESEAVVCGKGRIGGLPCFLFVMDARFMMGSMGSVVGEKIARLFEYATTQHLPVIGCTVSGGARMQEGILSLMQMAKTSGAVKRHSDEGNLFVCLLTDPTTGGVTASFAMEADIILAEPGALIAFAGPRVIEQTMRKKLPEGFQRAEFLLSRGFVDQVVPRAEQRGYLTRLLHMHKKEVVR